MWAGVCKARMEGTLSKRKNVEAKRRDVGKTHLRDT